MTYRVIQWASGGVGRAAMQAVIDHPDLELVGCWVHSADKEGVDLGTLFGGDPIGVTATTDVDALLATDADCVVYSPIFADPSVVTRILESGKNVVTPLGWFYPPDAERDRFDAVVPRRRRDPARHRHPPRRHHRALPADDLGPLGIDHARARRGVLRHPHLRRARRHPRLDAVRQDPRGGPREHHGRARSGAGFRQSVWMVADELGFDLDPELRTTHDMAVATAPIDSPIGPIQPGTVAAQRFRWEGLVDGEPVVTAAVNWLMGDADLDPAVGLRARGRALRGRGHRRPRHAAHLQGAPPAQHRGGPARATPASSPPRCTASTRCPTCAPPSPGC